MDKEPSNDSETERKKKESDEDEEEFLEPRAVRASVLLLMSISFGQIGVMASVVLFVPLDRKILGSLSGFTGRSNPSQCIQQRLAIAASFTYGLFVSIQGPVLLTLANNVGSSIGEVSWLFSGMSLGVLVGGIATGPIMRKIDNLLGFGMTCLLLSAVVIAIPWISALWLLVVVVMIGGICLGYLEAGMQALILQLWGEKESRGFISGYHFMIAVGAFLAPIIARPFLSLQDESERCPASGTDSKNSYKTTTTLHEVAPQFLPTIKSDETSEINPVVWAYLICGCILVAIGIFFFILSLWKIEYSVRKTRGNVVEDREEDPIKGLVLLFGLICFYYLFCVAGETTYSSYIYSVSICSDLSFEPSLGTMINSLFWIAFGLGRLGGVIFLRNFSLRNVILVGTIICITIVSIVGESTAAVTWTVTFLYGFFQATIYPAGVSWASKYTNMSGNYIFVFSAGQALGTMALVPAGGILFDMKPFYVMYLVLGCSVCNAIVYGLMTLEGERLKRKHKNESEEKQEISSENAFATEP